MIVDPSGEQGSFHRGRPRLRESLHPKVQTHPRGWNRAFPVNLPAAILHTVTDHFLVNIEPDVIHTLHRGASLVVSESVRSLSSVFLHQALLLTHTFKQLVQNRRIHRTSAGPRIRVSLRSPLCPAPRPLEGYG